MQLELLTGLSGCRASRLRGLDERRPQYLQLEHGGTRVARRADVVRMLKRVLAALTAQGVIAGASSRTHLVRAAATADQERAGEAGGAVLLGRQCVDALRVGQYALLDDRRIGPRNAGAKLEQQCGRLVPKN